MLNPNADLALDTCLKKMLIQGGESDNDDKYERQENDSLGDIDELQSVREKSTKYLPGR